MVMVLCLVCWVYMMLDSIAIRLFHDEIRSRNTLKAFLTYSWIASIAIGILLFAEILIQEVF